MALSIDQILDENIQLNPTYCSTVVYDQYQILETKQGATAIIGCPVDGARIQRDQLLDGEEARQLREQAKGFDTQNEMEKSLIYWNFEKWASKNGQGYKDIGENQPHTLMRLMRLEEKNEARHARIICLSEGLLFDKISIEAANNITENALEYCRMFGFPIGDIVESNNGNLYFGCIVDDLYFHMPDGLNFLYNRYMAWRYLQLRDESAGKQCFKLGGEPPISKQDFEDIVTGQVPISVNVQPVYKNGVSGLLSYCNSQLEMATLQLAYIIARGDHFMESKRVLNCKGCGNLFLATHGSRQYCDQCKANSTVRTRVSRAKIRKNR